MTFCSAGLLKVLLIITGGLLWSTTGWAAEWQLAAFPNTSVSAVVVNQRSPQEIAAIAQGVLHFSHDGGRTWVPGLLSVPASTVSYDLVYSGRIYAGTNGSGLFVSDNGGMSWQRFGPSTTHRKLVTALQTTDEYVFAAMYDGASTPVRVWRVAASGEAEDMGLPSDNTAALDYDYGRRKLYVGAAGGVYQSNDQGRTWSGGGGGAGYFTVGMVAEGDYIWQISPDGLFRSHDDGISWNRLAGPANINETYYGQDMHLSGLAASGNQAFFGAWSISFPYRFLVQYDGSASRSILNAKIASVASSGNQIWAAGENGLWVNDILSLNQPRVHRPALIIPGILGSLPTTASLAAYFPHVFTGYWDRSYQTPLVLDPISHSYDGLLQAFQDNGYVPDKSLFVFPYNWMQDNAVTASQLLQKLFDIRQLCKCSQVDVVAHSMGGLIARSYIASPAYQNDIRNLIQLGTPNAGSVAAYEVWEGGSVKALKPNSTSQLLNIAALALTDPAIAEPRAEELRKAVPSIKQLLPIFNYLSGRHYPEGYPTNSFLEQLNQPAEITRLKQRVALYVVGSLKHATLEALTVTSEAIAATLWPHGNVLASVSGKGDNTVLLSSLEAVAKSSLLLEANHVQLVSAAAPFVLQTFMGEYVPNVSVPMWPPQRFLTVYAAGPVALEIIAKDGQTINETKLEIPGAYYSGPSVRPQMAIIPASQDDDYAITVKGTAPGTYRVGTAILDPEDEFGFDMTELASTAMSNVAMIAGGSAHHYSYKGSDGKLVRTGPVEEYRLPSPKEESHGSVDSASSASLSTVKNQTASANSLGVAYSEPSSKSATSRLLQSRNQPSRAIKRQAGGWPRPSTVLVLVAAVGAASFLAYFAWRKMP